MRHRIPIEYETLSGIYQINCSANGRIYVGQTKCFVQRYCTYVGSLTTNKVVDRLLQADYNMYGQEVFCFEIVELAEERSMRLMREKYWIDLWRPEYNKPEIKTKPLGARVSPLMIQLRKLQK